MTSLDNRQSGLHRDGHTDGHLTKNYQNSLLELSAQVKTDEHKWGLSG